MRGSTLVEGIENGLWQARSILGCSYSLGATSFRYILGSEKVVHSESL